MHMTRALNLLLGRFTRQFLLRRYLPLVYGVLFGCFVIADILFPPDPVTGGPGYIPFLRTISGQGNHGDNPAGAWFFVAGLVITSVLLVPFNAYAWRRFAAACKGTATFAFTILVVASVGFAMVGIWDERSTCILLAGDGSCALRSNLVHSIGSTLAFGGNLLAVLVHLFPAIKAKRLLSSDVLGAWWQLVHVIIFATTAILAATIPELAPADAWTDVFLRSSFWQWTIFSELAIYYLSLAIRLPDEIPLVVARP